MNIEHDYAVMGPRTIQKGQIDEWIEFSSGHIAILIWGRSKQVAKPRFFPSPGYYVRWRLIDKPPASGQEGQAIHEAETIPCAGAGTARAQVIRDISEYIRSLD